jgi:hypothetical protein
VRTHARIPGVSAFFAREQAAREIAFIDPAVAAIPVLLAGLREGVAPILLDARRPAARQIAEALAGRRDLDAVHIIAHGAPGKVCFAAGEWSGDCADENLAAIGRALRPDGDLRLWSCDVARGAAGAAFVEALERASGAEVAAAAGLVGAAGLGGSWELEGGATAPLTAAGVGVYAGVMPGTAYTWNGGSVGNWNTTTSWSPSNGKYPGQTNGDSATINTASTVTLNVTPSGTLSTLIISNPSAVLSMGVNSLSFSSTVTTQGQITLA